MITLCKILVLVIGYITWCGARLLGKRMDTKKAASDADSSELDYCEKLNENSAIWEYSNIKQ